MEEFNWGVIITQVVLCWLAYKLGQISIIHRIAKDVAKEMIGQGLKLETDEAGNFSIEKEEIGLVIERVNSMYYAYSKDGKFLAQANDFRTLMETIKKQHPGQTFRLEKYQPVLTAEETETLIKSIVDVFGDREATDGKARQPVDR